jgi:hypothetical protein
MMAKMCDIPCVVLRTDFRRAGDNDASPWNLMLSGYPRVDVVVQNALQLYAAAGHDPTKLVDATAGHVIAALDRVCATPSVMFTSGTDVAAALHWAAAFAGASFATLCKEKNAIELVTAQRKKHVQQL